MIVCLGWCVGAESGWDKAMLKRLKHNDSCNPKIYHFGAAGVQNNGLFGNHFLIKEVKGLTFFVFLAA